MDRSDINKHAIQENQNAWERRGRLAIKIFGTIFALLLAPLIVQKVWARANAIKNLEYKTTVDAVSDYLPSNLEKTAKLTIRGQTYDDLYVCTVSIWNRTTEDIGRINILVANRPEGTATVHKVLIHSSDYEAGTDWVRWGNAANNDQWEVFADFTRINWTEQPNYRLRFFTNQKPSANLRVTSSVPGIRFEPYHDEKLYWWLFGWDGPAIALAFWCAFGIFAYGIHRFAKFVSDKSLEGYVDIYLKTASAEIDKHKNLKVFRLMEIAAAVYAYSLDKPIWMKRHRRALSMPPPSPEDQEIKPTPTVPKPSESKGSAPNDPKG